MNPGKLQELRGRYRNACAKRPKAADRARVQSQRTAARVALERALLEDYPDLAAKPDGPMSRCSLCGQEVRVFTARTWHLPPHLNRTGNEQWCRGGVNPTTGKLNPRANSYLAQPRDDPMRFKTVSGGSPTLGKRR